MNFNQLLITIAGFNDEIMDQQPRYIQKNYIQLGAIFLLNFIILAFIWGKVGYTNLGIPGALALGTIIPLALISIDRLIAMSKTPLDGEMSEFVSEEPQKRKKRYPVQRLYLSLSLIPITTFSFLLTIAQEDIIAESKYQAESNNSTLKAEYEEGAVEGFDQRIAFENETIDSLKSQWTIVDNKNSELKGSRQSLQAKARSEFDKSEDEKGYSINGRDIGCGDVCKLERAKYDNTLKDIKDLNDEISKSDGDSKTLYSSLEAHEAALAELMRKKDEVTTSARSSYKNDVRYINPTNLDFFKESTVFLSLFSKEDVAGGVIIATVMTVLGLLALELLGFIGLNIVEPSLFDVHLKLDEQKRGMMAINKSEKEVAETLSGHAPIRIIPIRNDMSKDYEIKAVADCETSSPTFVK